VRRHAGTPYGISPPREHPQVTAAVFVKTADKLHQSNEWADQLIVQNTTP
jgi:hypothetical protein